MGNVNFSSYVRVAGCYEPYENIYAYVYCDKCGSFSLESHTRQYTNTQIAVKATAIVGAALISGLLLWFTRNWVLGIVPCMIGLIIFICISRETYLRCKKCGNDDITGVNVLNYVANDESVLDVPNESIIKEHIHSIIPAM